MENTDPVRVDDAEAETPQPKWISLVKNAAASLRFGTIQVKIHDGEIVQIETTQRFRIEDSAADFELPPTRHREAK